MDTDMKNAILRLPTVIKLTGRSRSSIYAGIKDGSFVQPIKLGARSIGFLESEVDAWIESKVKESKLRKRETK